MKRKFTFLIAAAVMLLTMVAQPITALGQSRDNVTLQYTGSTTTNMTGGNDAELLGLSATDWSVVGDKGANSNFPGLNKAKDIRLYYHADGSNTITVTALNANYTISDIEITYTSQDYNNGKVLVGGNEVTGSSGVYDINATSFVVTNGNTSNIQVRISSIVINYTAGGGVTPTITLTPIDPGFTLGDVPVDVEISRQFKVTQSDLTANITLGTTIGNLSTNSVNQGAGETTVTWTHTPTSSGAINGTITATSDGATDKTITISGNAYEPIIGDHYEKVTEAPQNNDWCGAYIFTGINSNTYYALTGVTNNLGTTAPINVVGGTQIASNNTTDAYRVIVAHTTSGYSLYIDGVGYLSYSGSSNNISASNTFTASTCEWTISFANNVCTFTNVGSNTRTIRFNYNNGSPRFACYGSSSTLQMLTLFKYTGNVAIPLAAPVVALESGNHTITPTWADVMHASSYTLEWSTSSTFASDVHEISPATSGNAITELTNGTTYYVRVKAIGDDTNFTSSSWSAVVSEMPTGSTVTTPTFSVAGISTGTANEYIEAAEVTITAPDYNTHYIYYTTNGDDPDSNAELYDGGTIDIITTTTIKAIAYDSELNPSEIGSIIVNIIETTSIEDVFNATAGDTYYYIEGIVTYKPSNKNVYIEDATGGMLIYKNDNSFASGVSVGNKLIVKGQKEDAYGQPRFKNPTILDNDGQTNTLPLSEISVSQADDYMFRRVKFTQVLIGETSNNLTPISQGNNSVNVFSIPDVENVTIEGYYLKNLIGIVASYNQATQIYVASANDITAYNIDASSNNNSYGTVAVSGYVITATPASGYSYNEPSYVAVGGGTICNVTQTDNEFSVVTNGDAAVEIQFVSASSPCTVTYHVNGNVTAFAEYQNKLQNSEIGNLPTTEDIDNYDFAGWSVSESNISIIDETYVIGSVSTLNLFAVYSKTDYGIPVSSYQKVNEISEGQYLIVYETANVAFDGSRTNGDDDKIDAVENTIDVVINDNTIASDETTDAAIFNIAESQDKDDPTYTIQSASGFYIGRTVNSNGMDVATNNQYTNYIEFDNSDNAVITGNGGPTLRYNDASNQSRFRYYKSGQKDIQLYKKITTIPTTTSYYTRVYPSGNITPDDDLEITVPTVISDGSVLNMGANDLTCNDPANLVIEDGGQVIVNNTGVQATFKKSVSHSASKNAANWYTISSPVNNIAPGSVTNLIQATPANYDLYYYDEATTTWFNHKAAGHAVANMTNGKGYLYWNTDGDELSFPGELNSGTVEIAVTKTGTGDLAGFNLIGNPYSHNIYKGDGTAIPNSILSAGYYTLSNAGAWTAGTDNTTAIKPGQGILVKATAAGTVTMTNTTANGAKRNNEFIKFMIANSQYEDVAYALFNDEEGLNKINHRNADIPMLYIPQDGQNYAIATMSDETQSFNLNFKAMTTGQYTLSYKAEGNYDYLHVIDRLTGEDIDMLLDGEYSFIASPSDNDARFIVKLGYNTNNSAENDIFAYQNGSDIVVNGEGELQVFDVTGRMVATQHVNGVQTVNVPSQGVFIFKLNEKTQKIVVR